MSIEKVTLLSADGKEFVVAKTAAMLSETIGSMIEDGVSGGPIPLASVTSKVLDLVVSYCSKHSEPNPDGEDGDSTDLLDFDANFLRTVTADQKVLFDFIEVLALRSLYLPVLSRGSFGNSLSVSRR